MTYDQVTNDYDLWLGHTWLQPMNQSQMTITYDRVTNDYDWWPKRISEDHSLNNPS